jgi:hypothetical protein
MPVEMIFTKTTGLNESHTWAWDDATMDRFLAWAKATYPTITVGPDGITTTVSVPTDQQALRRASRGLKQGTAANIRARESDTAQAAVAAPAAIDIT